MTKCSSSREEMEEDKVGKLRAGRRRQGEEEKGRIWSRTQREKDKCITYALAFQIPFEFASVHHSNNSYMAIVPSYA